MQAPSQWSNSWYPSRRGQALIVTFTGPPAAASQTPGHRMFNGRAVLTVPACFAVAGKLLLSWPRANAFGPHNPGLTSPAQIVTVSRVPASFGLPGSGPPAIAILEPRHVSATRHATETLTIGMLAPHPAARGRDHPLYPRQQRV